jgi:hypothetical protein
VNIFRTIRCALLTATALMCIGCGGSGSNDNFGFADVENLAVADNSIIIGDGTAVAADLAYDPSAVQDGDRVFLVVRVPERLALRPDTSEIETTSGDDKVGAEVTNCASGEQFLLYDLDRFDLENAISPTRGANARLKFTLDGLSPGTAIVRARADTDRPIFGCGEDFLSDEEIAIEIN